MRRPLSMAATASAHQADIARPRAGENRTPLGAVVRSAGLLLLGGLAGLGFVSRKRNVA